MVELNYTIVAAGHCRCPQRASKCALTILRELRGVPEACPECGSPDLTPEQGENTAVPGVLWERPRCADCGWAGRPVPILDSENGRPLITREGEETHDHSIMTVPLRAIRKPGDPAVSALQDTETGPPEPTEYFAYGSNMATARLRQRMPSAKPLGLATLHGHELRFHKRSKDGSGKCNAFATDDNESAVVGVLFSFDPSERRKLDAAEGAGKGYDATMVTVVNDKGRRRKVLTYIASNEAIDESLKPYSWYKEHVLAGGQEHGLPQDYIDERIAKVDAVEDADIARAARERATHSVIG